MNKFTNWIKSVGQEVTALSNNMDHEAELRDRARNVNRIRQEQAKATRNERR